jgi:hypothetical protein
VSATLVVLRLLAGAQEPEALWELLVPSLARLSLEEVEELDRRIVLGPADLSAGEPPTPRRRVVNYLLQRKFAAFLYACFDPFVNPWQLEARMRELFWRMEFVRALADRLEAVAEANKEDPNLPWTVSSNLFGMANSALLAWHLGGWDDTVPGYGQGDPPPVLQFSPLAVVLPGEPRAPRDS